jgi:hypothetical protein
MECPYMNTISDNIKNLLASSHSLLSHRKQELTPPKEVTDPSAGSNSRYESLISEMGRVIVVCLGWTQNQFRLPNMQVVVLVHGRDRSTKHKPAWKLLNLDFHTRAGVSVVSRWQAITRSWWPHGYSDNTVWIKLITALSLMMPHQDTPTRG